MNEASAVVRLRQPEEIDDPLTAVLRAGARRLLAQAIEAEAESFLAAMADRRLVDGRARLARHGYGPERTVQTGLGPVEVRRVKVRDRAPAETGERVRFTSQLLPRLSAALTSRRGIGPMARWPDGPGAWRYCCRSCTCAGSRPATSRRRSPLCSARTRRTCRRR